MSANAAIAGRVANNEIIGRAGSLSCQPSVAN